tara:strand:+ start:6795 stop:7181 length:387 start_codon:yes stop_codon:yes gene_type:complete
MARTFVDLNDLVNTWREKTNEISYKIGDLANLATGGDSDLVQAINELHTEVSSNTTTLAGLSFLDSAQILNLIGGQFPVNTSDLADSSVTLSKMANDAIGQDQLLSVSSLEVYDSAGTLLKTFYGAGA